MLFGDLERSTSAPKMPKPSPLAGLDASLEDHAPDRAGDVVLPPGPAAEVPTFEWPEVSRVFSVEELEAAGLDPQGREHRLVHGGHLEFRLPPGPEGEDPEAEWDRIDWVGDLEEVEQEEVEKLVQFMQGRIREEAQRPLGEGSTPPTPERGGIDFKKLLERSRYEREHGPELDEEWAAGRAAGTIPIFACETHVALLTGNTFAEKDTIKGLGGRWDGVKKAWTLPPYGEADRKNFAFVKGHQAVLDSLATKGVVISYE